MSRIGKEPIAVPDGVKVSLEGGVFVAEGPKGKVSQKIVNRVEVGIEDGVIKVTRQGNAGTDRAMHGLMRALLANAVRGVSEGFTKVLEINGVGYRAEAQGKQIEFALGYSHPVVYAIPEGISVEVDKSNRITVSGADRQSVGQVAAEIRSLRKPEPYKGKGIKYVDEIIRRKVGKAGAAV
ncbi:MAG: 50S ribosomal protein L6 [Deltaproteobacteria bacterium]|nr:50S ribosomal protein L6 [Deltaproteobacteria bacterium]